MDAFKIAIEQATNHKPRGPKTPGKLVGAVLWAYMHGAKTSMDVWLKVTEFRDLWAVNRHTVRQTILDQRKRGHLELTVAPRTAPPPGGGQKTGAWVEAEHRITDAGRAHLEQLLAPPTSRHAQAMRRYLQSLVEGTQPPGRGTVGYSVPYVVARVKDHGCLKGSELTQRGRDVLAGITPLKRMLMDHGHA